MTGGSISENTTGSEGLFGTSGGGLFLDFYATASLTDVLIEFNSAQYGGGV